MFSFWILFQVFDYVNIITMAFNTVNSINKMTESTLLLSPLLRANHKQAQQSTLNQTAILALS